MSKKVLLIEPDAEDRKTYTATLRDQGFQVSTAKDGPTGLRIFKTLTPDAVVSNMVLGDMTAMDICEKIRSGQGNQPVEIILISNSKRSQKYVDGISEKYRVMGFLQKPFSPEAMTQMLRALAAGDGENPRTTASPLIRSDAGHAAAGMSGVKHRLAAQYFPGIFLEISAQKKTGSLLLKRSTAEDKTVFFEAGNLVGVESRVKSEQLGKVLVEKGVIEQNDYLKAAALMVEEGIHLGEALVKLGTIEQSVLKDLIRDHQVYKIASCFLWIDATAEFREGSIPPAIKNQGTFTPEEVFTAGRDLLKKVTNLRQVLKPVENEYFLVQEAILQKAPWFNLPESVLDATNKLRCGYVLHEVLVPENEEGLVLLYLTSAIVPGKPTPEMLVQRIEELKGNQTTNRPVANGELEEKSKMLEALLKENQNLKQLALQHRTELEVLKNSVLEDQKIQEHEKNEIARLQKALQDLQRSQKGYGEDGSQTSPAVSKAIPPSPPIANVAAPVEESIDPDVLFKDALASAADTAAEPAEPSGFDLTSDFEVPDMQTPPSAEPIAQAAATPTDFFDLAGDLPSLEGLEANAPASPLEATQVHNPHAPASSPPSPPPAGDDFELPSLDGLEEMVADNPDRTVVFTPPPIPDTADAGAQSPLASADDLPADFGSLETDFDMAFEGAGANAPANPAPLLDDPFAPQEAAPETSPLPIDPFAPPTNEIEATAPSPAGPQSNDELDDFFSLTE